MQVPRLALSEVPAAARSDAAGDAKRPWGTSLVSYAYRSVDIELFECPRRPGYRRVNIDTGETFNVRCRANHCPYCGPQNAWLAGGAMAYVKPERFGTLTAAGADWQTIRRRMFRLAYAIREHGISHEWVYSVEPNPRGTGHHAHFWQHGDFIPQGLLSSLARAEGMGRVVDIRAWTPRSSSEVITYGVKLEGIRYGVKSVVGTEEMSRFLIANGGRLIHPSRGYWRGSTQREVQDRFVAERFGLDAENDARYRVMRVASAGH